MAEEFTPSLEIAFYYSLLFAAAVKPVLVVGRGDLQAVIEIHTGLCV
jgi:hypothetical protein